MSTNIPTVIERPPEPECMDFYDEMHEPACRRTCPCHEDGCECPCHKENPYEYWEEAKL